VNALIFAVLAAAVALAYYGYSYTAEVASRDRQLETMKELGDEKLADLENWVVNADMRLLGGVQLDRIEQLDDQVKHFGAGVSSVFVLDDQLKLVLGGSSSVGRDAKDAIAIRDWYLANVIPKLGLPKLPVSKRGHFYGRGKPGEPAPSGGFLLSYMRKQLQDGRTYYVVVEDDVNHFVMWLFPQYFSIRSNHRYQVVDELGTFRSGFMYSFDPGALSEKFTDTLDGWELRITESDPDGEKVLRRKRVIDSVLIGAAVTIVLAGLAFLALAIRRERRANELKSDFISNVSHELKTPLSIISMFGEMLANNRTKSPEQATEYAEIIWRESVRLGRLIDNVLDFAKIERGMGVYEFAEADVGEVVTRAIDLATRRLANADMTLEADIEPELPLVQLDANAFTLAVLNLIDNAIKYAADGKKVSLSLKRDGERIVLAVRDYGPGIDPEEHERIFERFYRAKAMRLKPIRGSGIGLALVQHIARAHGGDIAVTSTPGSGATFQLWLPV
jgi:two-component system phosphate regulon sensor histidine kinase PhoR